MVKINITIEGEDITGIMDELFSIGISLVKNNRKEVREILKLFSEESLDVLFERKTLERGAELYRKLNNEINWSYKQNKLDK